MVLKTIYGAANVFFCRNLTIKKDDHLFGRHVCFVFAGVNATLFPALFSVMSPSVKTDSVLALPLGPSSHLRLLP